MSAGNPTERPEERDSLAEIEERLAKAEAHAPFCDCLILRSTLADLRTLINEVKERETERAMWERAAKNGSDRILDLEAEVKELREENEKALEVCRLLLLANNHPSGEYGQEEHDIAAHLAGDVLDEDGEVENPSQHAMLLRRIKQMEEALREVLPWTEFAVDSDNLGDADRARLSAAINNARAALSPSDTEEEA